MADRTAHHARAVGLSNLDGTLRLCVEFADGSTPDHVVLVGFTPNRQRMVDLIDRAAELVRFRKVYIDADTGAVSLNPTGELDLAGMLASEGLGTISKLDG